MGSFVHLQRGHVSKWYIAFICPIIPHLSFILSQNYLKWKMTHLSTSKKQFLVFQKGIKSGWHNLKVLPRSYSIIPEPLVIESWNSEFRFLFSQILSQLVSKICCYVIFIIIEHFEQKMISITLKNIDNNKFFSNFDDIFWN